jgi:L-2-hydroxyglutarate oxidase LhgO
MRLRKLQSIRAHAEANGVLDLHTLSGDAARALEPALNCDAALLSPSTGIIDSHAFMLALRGDAEDAGAAFAFHTPTQPPHQSPHNPLGNHTHKSPLLHATARWSNRDRRRRQRPDQP